MHGEYDTQVIGRPNTDIVVKLSQESHVIITALTHFTFPHPAPSLRLKELANTTKALARRLVCASILVSDPEDSHRPQRRTARPTSEARPLPLEFGTNSSRMARSPTWWPSTDSSSNAFTPTLGPAVIQVFGNKWPTSLCRSVKRGIQFRL